MATCYSSADTHSGTRRNIGHERSGLPVLPGKDLRRGSIARVRGMWHAASRRLLYGERRVHDIRLQQSAGGRTETQCLCSGVARGRHARGEWCHGGSGGSATPTTARRHGRGRGNAPAPGIIAGNDGGVATNVRFVCTVDLRRIRRRRRRRDTVTTGTPAAQEPHDIYLVGRSSRSIRRTHFYAGYKKKGTIQLAVTLLTVGFAGPMIWVWAVIDICTINQDHLGVQFEA